jgi:hypothetical protein
MKDKEWCKGIEGEINRLKNRVKILEGDDTCGHGLKQKIIELDIKWPESDIGGLHFNEQKTHGVFELKDDGNYYSRDILFVSARDTDEGTGRDILSEYLESDAVKEAFCACLDTDTESYFSRIKILLPEKNQGIKKYNGVTCGYWLLHPYSTSTSNFTYVDSGGGPAINGAGVAYGVAPDFCVA